MFTNQRALEKFTESLQKPSTYVGDTASLVADHHGKVGHTNIFWFLSAYKSYVYTILYSIKCVTALYLKKVHTIMKNTLLLQSANHYLSFSES